MVEEQIVDCEELLTQCKNFIMDGPCETLYSQSLPPITPAAKNELWTPKEDVSKCVRSLYKLFDLNSTEYMPMVDIFVASSSVGMKTLEDWYVKRKFLIIQTRVDHY